MRKLQCAEPAGMNAHGMLRERTRRRTWCGLRQGCAGLSQPLAPCGSMSRLCSLAHSIHAPHTKSGCAHTARLSEPAQHTSCAPHDRTWHTSPSHDHGSSAAPPTAKPARSRMATSHTFHPAGTGTDLGLIRARASMRRTGTHGICRRTWCGLRTVRWGCGGLSQPLAPVLLGRDILITVTRVYDSKEVVKMGWVRVAAGGPCGLVPRAVRTKSDSFAHSAHALLLSGFPAAPTLWVGGTGPGRDPCSVSATGTAAQARAGRLPAAPTCSTCTARAAVVITTATPRAAARALGRRRPRHWLCSRPWRCPRRSCRQQLVGSTLRR